MADDPWDHPSTKAWAKHVVEKLIPMIRDSGATVSLVPDESDVKFAVELGFSIMFDKPIILAVPAGRVIPGHLVRVADEIVELHDPPTPEDGLRVRDAVGRVAERGSRPDGSARAGTTDE